MEILNDRMHTHKSQYKFLKVQEAVNLFVLYLSVLQIIRKLLVYELGRFSFIIKLLSNRVPYTTCDLKSHL